MKEVEFRGQNDYTKKWIYGYFVNHDNYPQIWVLDKQGKGSFPQPIDFETLGEFTGLKDKSGKECYNKDIVEFTVPGIDTHLEILTGIIEWEKNIASFYIKVITKETEQKKQWRMDREFEIIGNIHENKNLLES